MSGHILVNGQTVAHRVATVADLLRDMGIDTKSGGVAVALNRRIVPRSRWSEQKISSEDQVEIVRAVKGG
jgi:sulfur carrier protein